MRASSPPGHRPPRRRTQRPRLASSLASCSSAPPSTSHAPPPRSSKHPARPARAAGDQAARRAVGRESQPSPRSRSGQRVAATRAAHAVHAIGPPADRLDRRDAPTSKARRFRTTHALAVVMAKRRVPADRNRHEQSGERGRPRDHERRTAQRQRAHRRDDRTHHDQQRAAHGLSASLSPIVRPSSRLTRSNVANGSDATTAHRVWPTRTRRRALPGDAPPRRPGSLAPRTTSPAADPRRRRPRCARA